MGTLYSFTNNLSINLSSSVNKKKVFSADLNNKKIHNFVIHSLKMLIFIKTVQNLLLKYA